MALYGTQSPNVYDRPLTLNIVESAGYVKLLKKITASTRFYKGFFTFAGREFREKNSQKFGINSHKFQYSLQTSRLKTFTTEKKVQFLREKSFATEEVGKIKNLYAFSVLSR